MHGHWQFFCLLSASVTTALPGSPPFFSSFSFCLPCMLSAPKAVQAVEKGLWKCREADEQKLKLASMWKKKHEVQLCIYFKGCILCRGYLQSPYIPLISNDCRLIQDYKVIHEIHESNVPLNLYLPYYSCIAMGLDYECCQKVYIGVHVYSGCVSFCPLLSHCSF